MNRRWVGVGGTCDGPLQHLDYAMWRGLPWPGLSPIHSRPGALDLGNSVFGLDKGLFGNQCVPLTGFRLH